MSVARIKAFGHTDAEAQQIMTQCPKSVTIDQIEATHAAVTAAGGCWTIANVLALFAAVRSGDPAAIFTAVLALFSPCP